MKEPAMRIAAILCIFVLLVSTLAASQTKIVQFLARANSAPTAERTAIVDSFINYARATRGIPFIEGDTAMFIWRGTATSAAVAGDMNGWSTSAHVMSKLSGTNFFYYIRTFERNARLDYKIVINGSNWILDPQNPKQVSGGYGPNSELAMPEYVQPWEIQYRPSIPHGSLASRRVASAAMGASYTVQIYLPPGYDTTKRYPSVYFQDGGEYVSLASARNVIDNLIDSNKIQPVIGVFVTPNNRNIEYAGGQRNAYHTFFATELVPFIDSIYRTERDPASRLVLGDSYGGNISALIAYHHSGVFGNCGIHSGAFQQYNYEADTLWYRASPRPMKFVSIWGTYEPLWGDMRRFRDTMKARGYPVTWRELPEGHSWGLWRATLDIMLETVFPALPAGVEADLPVADRGFRLDQNYPNPFNPSTQISFMMERRQYVRLAIYTMLGEEVATLFDGMADAGQTYTIPFDGSSLGSGIYWYRISTAEGNVARKMVLLR